MSAHAPQPVPPRALRVTGWLPIADDVEERAAEQDAMGRGVRHTYLAMEGCSDQRQHDLTRRCLKAYALGLSYLAGHSNYPRVLHVGHPRRATCSPACLYLDLVEVGADQGEYHNWVGDANA